MADPMASSSIANDNDTMASNGTDGPQLPQLPQLAVLDYFFPGFSSLVGVIQKYLGIDLNLYIPLLLLAGILTIVWNYISQYFWDNVDKYFMSAVDIRTDDEIYNMFMAWIARQPFSKGSRRFVVNTNLRSRFWSLWLWDDASDDEEESTEPDQTGEKGKKALSYTPAFGSHYFFYRGRLLLFRRTANREQTSFMTVSEREEISLSCFGRNPWILKELLREARQQYLEKDEQKTLIYRGITRPGSGEPEWQRCLARATRPFSSVILNEKVKNDLIEDVRDYLNPATRRWYSNRGIPYRRGYLLHGPPGTGKSSLSLALAGFFKMRIHIVSLSSTSSTEENLASLFAELPRRCVVLLEDIDSAGITHTREESQKKPASDGPDDTSTTSGVTTGGVPKVPAGRLTLSGLLNILDGVASQEGRVLIMTTNHVENLDKALIRPGRVDMVVKFGLADRDMTASIFRAIFSHLEGDDGPEPIAKRQLDPDARSAYLKEKEKKREAADAHVAVLAEEFAEKVPTHEFSPAELQGYLMRHKRNAQAAVTNVEEFIETTRKDRKEKELKEAEEKRKAEEAKEKADAEKKAAEAKKKEEEANKSKEKNASQEKEGDASMAVAKPAPTITIEPPVSRKLEVKTEKETEEQRHDSGYATPTSGEP